MSTTFAKKPASYWVHVVIMFLFMFCFGFLPSFGGDITVYGMKVLGIFIGTFYGWITIGFMWPSLLGMVALGLSDYGTIREVFAEGLANENTLNIFLVFVFAAYLEKAGTLTWVTYWLISRKSLVGKPWLFTTMFIFSIIPIAMFVNVYAGIVLLWGVFASICKEVGYTKNDFYVTYVCGGIAQVGGIVSICYPFQPFTQLIYSLSGAATGATELPFMQWSAFGTCALIVFPLAYILLGKILRVDASKLKNMGDNMAQYRGIKMTPEQKFGMFLLLLFIVLLVLPSVTSGAAKGFFGHIGLQGAAIICLILEFIYQEWQGGNIFSFGNMVNSGVSWDLIMLFVVTFPLCTAMESADAGVISTVIGLIMPIVNVVSPMVFLIIVMVVFCLVTQVSHNLVLIIALTPSLARICVGVGIDPIMFGMVFCWAMLTSSATPAASANTAMVFGHTDWVERKYAYKVGIANMIMWLLVNICIMLPIGFLIF